MALYKNLNLLNELSNIGIPVEEVVSIYTYQNRKNDEYITELGKIEKNIYFVLSGCVRTFCIDSNGEEKNVNFYFENSFVTSFNSFIGQTPAKIGIQCLEDTFLVAINRDKLFALYEKFPKLKDFSYKMSELGTKEILDLYIDQLTLTATERYAKFLEENPENADRISVKHLAMYLGIHPNSLSRIRKEIKNHGGKIK